MKKATASRLAVGLMLSVALPGLSAASDPGEQLMLARASYWRAQQRPDLAAEVLNKLLSANPGQPDALYQQGVLALEQGDRGGAQRYFDRLHQLAPADARAKELTALLAQPAVATVAPAPMAVTTAPASAPVTAVSNVTPVQMPVTRMLPTASASPVATPAAAQKRPELTVASADSDDLTPAKPASASPPAPAGAPASAPTAAVSHLAAATSEAAYPRNQQVAALPPVTISDGNTTIPSTTLAVASAGSNDLGNTAKSVQVAQVELEPPPPIGGYQATLALKPYSPSDTLETYIDRDLARLEAEAAPTLIAGLGFRTHSGTEGTVGLNEFGGTAQFSFSPFDTGSATIAVLPVYLDAGTPANINLQRFGANPVLAAAGLPLASAGDQNASGVGLLGSYTYGDFSGQLGTTPLGFPVTNIVGNVAYTPKFLDGNLAVRFEAVRQPVTDTVLSYAGTHANLATANAVTAGAFGGYGRTWGGVVKTGPHALAFYDDQNIGI
ncbi:MAG TPA: cellulose synthase subunit BcsC-related outer membrane protein, partial [Stellaceae bacterium]|nr:cellulose synthase subunit BcsC-related outer membrane protein [Stellaceae bacterium]